MAQHVAGQPSQTKLKIVVFSPYSGIWRHTFPEALVAEALSQQGHDVIYVTCDEQLKGYCLVMAAMGIASEASPNEKQRACAHCHEQKRILQTQFGFKNYDLGDVLTQDDRDAIRHAMDSVRPDNFLDLTLDGIEVGRYSLYEFLLNLKKIDLDFSESEWQTYLKTLESALIAFYAGRRILDREQPDRVFTYNSLYSTNRVFSVLARSRGVSDYFLHAGGNLSNRIQTLMVGQEHTLHFFRRLIQEWPAFRDLPVPREQLSYVTDHFMSLFEGRNAFAYSSPKQAEAVDIRSFLGVRPGQKLLLATMSSYDERFAAETVRAVPDRYDLLFPLQVDWIKALVDYVRDRDDLFLVIRVHPREFPNKRENVKSQHARLLEQEFVDLPPNVRVNWPSDQLSLYDIADQTDVVLCAWSSVGKEMSLLGLPVVIYSPDLVQYPADLNYVGTTRDAYFAQIEQALADGWSIENTRKAYRWLVMEQSTVIMDLSDSYKESETPKFSLPQKVINRIRSRFSPYYRQIADARKRSPRLRESLRLNAVISQNAPTVLNTLTPESLPRVSLEDETRFLKQEVARLEAALYGGQKAMGSGLRTKLRSFIDAEAGVTGRPTVRS